MLPPPRLTFSGSRCTERPTGKPPLLTQGRLALLFLPPSHPLVHLLPKYFLSLCQALRYSMA